MPSYKFIIVLSLHFPPYIYNCKCSRDQNPILPVVHLSFTNRAVVADVVDDADDANDVVVDGNVSSKDGVVAILHNVYLEAKERFYLSLLSCFIFIFLKIVRPMAKAYRSGVFVESD